MVEHLDGFRCLILDRPGTGLSEPIALTRADVETYGDQLVGAALDALGHDRADVVASSVGGYFAIRSAAAAPDRIRRMVLMGAPPFIKGMAVPGVMRMMMIDPLRRVMDVFPPNRRVSKMMLKQIGHGDSLKAGRISQPLLDWSFSLQRDTDTMRNDGNLIGVAGSRKGFDPTLTLDDDVVRAVTAPVLLLWGDDDVFGSPDAARAFAALLPNAELELLPHSGHLPWLHDPAGLGARTASFLAAGS